MIPCIFLRCIFSCLYLRARPLNVFYEPHVSTDNFLRRLLLITRRATKAALAEKSRVESGLQERISTLMDKQVELAAQVGRAEAAAAAAAAREEERRRQYNDGGSENGRGGVSKSPEQLAVELSRAYVCMIQAAFKITYILLCLIFRLPHVHPFKHCFVVSTFILRLKLSPEIDYDAVSPSLRERDKYMAEAHSLSGEINELRRAAAIPKSPEAAQYAAVSPCCTQEKSDPAQKIYDLYMSYDTHHRYAS